MALPTRLRRPDPAAPRLNQTQFAQSLGVSFASVNRWENSQSRPSQGEIGEQTLYDRTTDYIRDYYNRARILNRSAAHLAMSVFQRRLASSTYSMVRSFERRIAKLDNWIDDNS